MKAKFGLNPGLYITELDFRDTYLYLEIGTSKSEKYPFKGFMWGANKNKDPEKQAKLTKAINLSNILDVVGLYVPIEVNESKELKEQGFDAVADYFTPKMRKVKLDSIRVDLFLQYQWRAKPGKDKKFLELPNSPNWAEDGKWICKHMPGEWEANTLDGGLFYYDAADPIDIVKHPFFRTKEFMLSENAKP